MKQVILSASKIILVPILLFLTLPLNGQANTINKISPSLEILLNNASPDEKIVVWVYLNEKQGSIENSFISEKSRRRRARVDRINFLLDEKDIPLNQKAVSAIKNSGATIRHQSKWFNALSVEANKITLEKISSLSFVRKIELLKKISKTLPPENEYGTRKSFTDNNIILPLALDYGPSFLQNQFTKSTKLHTAGLTGKGVLIAIFDSGFKTNHPAFDSLNLFATYDFINNIIPVDSLDCPGQLTILQQNFHGTAVLGTMAGNVPGELIGSAYEASYALAKTEITCSGIEIKIEEDNWIAAAEWADSIGADIISSSLGYYFFQDSSDYLKEQLDGNSALITRAADIAASKNILLFNSAGNERKTSWGTIIFPADADSVIAVGAVLSDSSLASFSSPGPTADGRIKPDVVTLGSVIHTANFQGGYSNYSGTSFSTPLVSAGAALAFQHDSSMTAEEYRKLIKETASQFQTPDNDFGYGLFDAALAADIIKINKSGNFILFLNDSLTIHITTSGRSQSIPVLATINLPAGSQFVDSGNGSGKLILTGTRQNDNLSEFTLTASVGYYTDSTNFTLETYASVAQYVIAAPNPFAESVRFLLSSNAGNLKSISIFNIVGEKIWEYLNSSTVFAEETIVWDGTNSRGEKVSSGVYLAYIRAENYEGNVKLLKIE